MTETITLSQLRDHLHVERQISDIEDLDKHLIQQARDRVRKIENDVKACHYTVEEIEEREAIHETLHEITHLRGEKIMILAKYPEVVCPLNRLLPSETKLYQDIRSAVLVYREACQ
jgi:DNA replication initiation complex subunit (GINS family)